MNSKDKSEFNVELPARIDPKYLRAEDILVTTRDKNAKVSTPIPSNDGKVWKFEVIASDGVTTAEYTIYVNGYSKDPVAGDKLVVKKGDLLTRDDAKKAIDPKSIDTRNVEAYYWEVTPSTKDARDNVPGKVKVLYKDGTSRIVDVYIDVVSGSKEYVFYIRRDYVSPGGYRIDRSSTNPDNNTSINVEGDSGYGKITVQAQANGGSTESSYKLQRLYAINDATGKNEIVKNYGDGLILLEGMDSGKTVKITLGFDVK